MPIVLKSASLNLLEPSGSVQACNGIALPLLGWYFGVILLGGLDFVTGLEHCGFYACEETGVIRKSHRVFNLKVDR